MNGIKVSRVWRASRVSRVSGVAIESRVYQEWDSIQDVPKIGSKDDKPGDIKESTEGGKLCHC